MDRRSFLETGFLLTGGVLFAPSLLAAENSKRLKKITILHTNDTHSNIDPFPDNHAKFPGMGGVEKRMMLIEKIRSEEAQVLLLDSGDIFQGTPYFNKYKGVLEMKCMSAMGYDAATMGNHDFDGGMEGFLKAIEHADFPFLCANYDFTGTLLNKKTQPTKVFKKGGVKIGVFGVGVELKGLVPDTIFGKTQYLDPIKVANECALELKKEGCDLIICLSHLGYEYGDAQVSDKVIAANSEHIHVILGGHTHTFLAEPTQVKNRAGNTVLINQTGWGGVHLGRLDFYVDDQLFAKKEMVVVQ
jgi:5'-nucleotidase